MINNRAMPVLLSTRRVALHHPRSSPTVNDFAGALSRRPPGSGRENKDRRRCTGDTAVAPVIVLASEPS